MLSHGVVTEQQVFEDWRLYDGRPDTVPIRTDIIHARFPRDAEWHDAEIEAHDVANLFLISVGDLGPFSSNTWSLEVTAKNYSSGFHDPDHSIRFEKLLKRPMPFDTRLVVVSDTLSGPFTVIDGNHRAVLLLVQKRPRRNAAYTTCMKDKDLRRQCLSGRVSFVSFLHAFHGVPCGFRAGGVPPLLSYFTSVRRHRRTLPSRQPVAASVPSGLTATSVAGIGCGSETTFCVCDFGSQRQSVPPSP